MHGMLFFPTIFFFFFYMKPRNLPQGQFAEAPTYGTFMHTDQLTTLKVLTVFRVCNRDIEDILVVFVKTTT